MSKPKILFIDIETSPLTAYTWGIWDQNVALNQVRQDWNIISWAAKWDDSKKVIQQDLGDKKDFRNDKPILKKLWGLLDEAQIVIGQNSKAFDVKKINARFVMHGMKPPSSFKQIDTKLLAKKAFGFTSNSLEYMTDKLCTKYKKLKHKKFPGMELWIECLKGNNKAWKEMREYNIHDVLALEELYGKLQPWGTGINFNLYHEGAVCGCGSTKFKKNGHSYESTGAYRRYKCTKCGDEYKDTKKAFKVDRKPVVR